MADYVIAPKLSLERPDLTVLTDSWYPVPYAHYTPAMVEAEDDVMEEWEFLLGHGAPDGHGDQARRRPRCRWTEKPSTDDVLDLITANSRIPLDRVREADGGAIFEGEEVRVSAEGREVRTPAWTWRRRTWWRRSPEVRAEPVVEGAGYLPGEEFSHRLISRRMREFYNSSGRDISGLTARDGGTNPAFMNPVDAGRVRDRGRRR